VFEQGALYLGREEVLAAADDHLLHPAADLQIAPLLGDVLPQRITSSE
jgi:hypothetical protein